MMNPLLFADWAHIHRVFRGLMWLVATALVLVIFFSVSSRAAGHAHSAPPTAIGVRDAGH